MKKIIVVSFYLSLLFQIAVAQNVGIGTNSPTAKLTINGNLALLSDTIRVSCDIFPAKMIIDNITKLKSVFHIINDGCGALATPPTIAGISGGSDGKIVTLISHVDNMQIQHLQANTAIPTATDSLNMIENGQWVTNKIATLYGRDAGTDSGVTFTSPDQVTVPRSVVTAFTGFPAIQDGAIVPFGTFTFT